MQFYVISNGQQDGPFTPDQVRGYLNIGQFQHTDLAWHDGLPDWRPLGEFPEFAPREHRTPNYKSMPVRPAAVKQAKSSKGVLVALLVVVIVAGAGAGGFFAWRYYQRKAAAAADSNSATNAPVATPENADAKATPKTQEELNRWYEEPASGQNAATFFQQGFDAFQLTDEDKNSSSLPVFGKARLPTPTVALSASMKTAVRGFLERNQSAMGFFQQGARCSGSRYPVDLTQGANATLAHLAKLRQAAQLGELSALSNADARNGTNAAQGVLLALASARTLDAEPLLISQLVRVAAEGLAVDALEQTVNRVTLPADTLTELQAAFGRAAEYEVAGTGFNRALAGERASGLALFDLSPDKLQESLANLTTASGGQRKTAAAAQEKVIQNLKAQRRFYDDSFNQILTARKEALPARLKVDDAWTSRATEARSNQYALCTLLLPGLEKTTRKEAASLARLSLAQTAVALERFRGANRNQYPQSLTELVPQFLPAVLTDPFDGQPLRYRKVGTGYVCYSIGSDLKDDNGERKTGSDDLVFTVGKPLTPVVAAPAPPPQASPATPPGTRPAQPTRGGASPPGPRGGAGPRRGR